MDITLSWDLFIIVFCALIMAFSFIVGRKQTIKIIIANYVSFLTADALGLFINNTVGFELPARLFGFDPITGAIVTKIIMFMILVIIFSRHHSFDVGVEDGPNDVVYLVSTGFIGALSATLMVSSVLFFISADSLTLLAPSSPGAALGQIQAQSELVQKILSYFHVWFFLPALSLIFLTFLQKK